MGATLSPNMVHSHAFIVSILCFTATKAGVPHNVPCLTGATVQGTTVPPCSKNSNSCDTVRVRSDLCAVVFKDSEEKRRFVWWQFWNLSFKNSISSITVQDGCIFQGYHNNDFSGTPLIIRAVGNIRHVDLIDAEFNYFNNNLESYECKC